MFANWHDITVLEETPDCYEIETILGVLEIEDSLYLGVIKKGELVGLFEGCEVFKIVKIDFIPIIICAISELVVNLKHFIQTHDFYYTKEQFMENRFIWNLHLIDKLKTEGEEWTIQHKPPMRDKDFGYCYMFCGFFSSKSFKIV